MATVRLPPQLRAAAGGQKEVDAGGTTVADVLGALTDAHPDLAGQLFDGDGELQRFVNVYVDGEDVRVGDGLATAVDAAGTVMIMPAMAGGGA